jgi:hypothetical protein
MGLPYRKSEEKENKLGDLRAVLGGFKPGP